MASSMRNIDVQTVGKSTVALSFAVVAAGLPIAAVAFLHLAHGIPIARMTRDVAAIADLHPLAGFLSNLGIVLWTTSAAIWLFSAFLLRASGALADASFALGFGLLTSYLAIDDLFQVHETLAPIYLGLDERIVYALLATAVIVLLLRGWRALSEGPVWLLAAAFMLLGASASADLLHVWLWRLGPWAHLLEDGLKWLGIVSWTAYGVAWCKAALLSRSARA